MTRPRLYILIFAAVILEVTALSRLEIVGVKPDLAFAIVVFAGLFAGPARGLEAGIVASLVNDIFAFDFFCMNAALMGLAGFLAGIIGPKVYRESPLTLGLILFLLNAVAMIIHFYAASSLLKGALQLTAAEYALHSIIPASLYTSLVAAPFLSMAAASYRERELEELL